MTPTVCLGEICTFTGGGTPSRKISEYWNGDVPWATVKDFASDRISQTMERISRAGLTNSATRIVPAGTVLLVTRVGLGKVAIAEIDLAINQDVKALFPSSGVVPEYLLWALKHVSPNLVARGTGATVKGVTLKDVKELEIPLPPLDEQRRIVAILDRAAKIERLRARAAERMREFAPSLFERMFGDPIENPKGWAVAKLADVGTLDRGRSRHRPRNAPELYGGPYPFVQTGDVAASGGAIRQASQRYSELGLKQSKMWPAGTLCITIAANIGETGILAFDACFPDSVVGFVPKKDVVTVEYVQGALDSMQARLEERAPMAAQRNINLRILRALTVALPPIEMQRRFSGVVRQARDTAETVGGATGSASMVTQALMQNLLGNPREC